MRIEVHLSVDTDTETAIRDLAAEAEGLGYGLRRRAGDLINYEEKIVVAYEVLGGVISVENEPARYLSVSAETYKLDDHNYRGEPAGYIKTTNPSICSHCEIAGGSHEAWCPNSKEKRVPVCIYCDVFFPYPTIRRCQ